MIGELKASSVSPSFIDLDPGLMKVSLWLRLGYLPKVASNSFLLSIVVVLSFLLHSLNSQEIDQIVQASRR